MKLPLVGNNINKYYFLHLKTKCIIIKEND